MTNVAMRATQRRMVGGLLATCAGLGGGFLLAPAAAADPPATCQSRHVDGVEEDVCVGIPGQAGGANPRDLYPGVVPELYFGIGLGL
ncbi:hypothetical protein [Mycolicibacterium aubagnense]|nr:hypothetical protein [Mycolicibacterium aubagnense]WGI31401.1 hypothetical protein QDT91_19450 [Mycolicibacterium aubagnense]